MIKTVQELLEANNDVLEVEALRIYALHCANMGNNGMLKPEVRQLWIRLGQKVRAIYELRKSIDHL